MIDGREEGGRMEMRVDTMDLGDGTRRTDRTTTATEGPTTMARECSATEMDRLWRGRVERRLGTAESLTISTGCLMEGEVEAVAVDQTEAPAMARSIATTTRTTTTRTA